MIEDCPPCEDVSHFEEGPKLQSCGRKIGDHSPGKQTSLCTVELCKSKTTASQKSKDCQSLCESSHSSNSGSLHVDPTLDDKTLTKAEASSSQPASQLPMCKVADIAANEGTLVNRIKERLKASEVQMSKMVVQRSKRRSGATATAKNNAKNESQRTAFQQSHGLSGSSSFQPCLRRRREKRHSLLMVARPGHGGNDGPECPPPASPHVEDRLPSASPLDVRQTVFHCTSMNVQSDAWLDAAAASRSRCPGYAVRRYSRRQRHSTASAEGDEMRKRWYEY